MADSGRGNRGGRGGGREQRGSYRGGGHQNQGGGYQQGHRQDGRNQGQDRGYQGQSRGGGGSNRGGGDRGYAGGGPRGGTRGRGGGFEGPRGGGGSISFVSIISNPDPYDQPFNAEYSKLGWHFPTAQEPKDLKVQPYQGIAGSWAEKEITVAVNHFPLVGTNGLAVPPIMYHYQIEMEIRRERKSKPKPDAAPAGGSGQQPNPPRKKELPKALSHTILFTLLPKLREEYNFYGMVSDNRHNLYSTRDLTEVMRGDLSYEIKLSEIEFIDDDEGEGVVAVSFHSTGLKIDTAALAQKYAQDKTLQGFSFDPDFKQSLEAAMNALVRSFPQYRYVSVGRSSLIPWQEGDGVKLGGGLVAWKGVSANITMGWRPYLNVDIANCAFWVGKNVTELLEEMFDARKDFRDKRQTSATATDVTTWKNNDFKVANQLSTCKFQYITKDKKKFGGTIKKIIPESVSIKTFMLEEGGKSQKISINDYFKLKKGMPLKHPNGPCIQFGDNKFVPAEICTIKKGQSYNRREMEPGQTTEMLKTAKQNPGPLKADIERQLDNLKLVNNKVLKSLEISIPAKMLEMKARVLPAPAIRYGTGADGRAGVVTPGPKGDWQAYGNKLQFYRPTIINKWGILLIECRGDQQMLKTFINDLQKYGGDMGIAFNSPPHPIIWEQQRASKDKLAKYLQQDFKGCDLVLVVLPTKNSHYYGEVKHAAEVDIGMLTQCVVSPNIFFKPSPSTVQNILLKINSKAGGINHVTVPPINAALTSKFFNLLMECPVLIMGADVTHPQTRFMSKDGKTEFTPSYAAVTGSIDRTCMPFMTELRAQAKAEKGAAEVIEDMEDIVVNFLKTFREKVRGIPPKKIVYLRDGVGDGQFPELLHKEMLAIRRACFRASSSTNYQPKITFVTVQKRHKTRIFHQTDRGTTDQAPPGTVIDTEIVHTTENDFYLLSHHGLQGTSRPTRYHVLWDDSDFSKDQIQSMIYTLCYMYCRCTRSVSLPAPTYYAHLAAERAKKIMEGFEGPYPTKESLNAILKPVADNMRTHPMHFV